MRLARGFLLGLIAVAATVYARVASAAQPLVVIVRSAAAGGDVEEAVVRLRAELGSVGFDVISTQSPADVEPRESVELQQRARHPAATIGIFGNELWLVDRLTAKTTERTLEVDQVRGRRAPEVIAIRAAELLRASLMELLLAPNGDDTRAEQPTPVPVHQWLAAALDPGLRPLRPGFELGGATVASFRGVPLAAAPVLRARLSLSENLILRLSGTGLGTRPEIHSGGDAAFIEQEVAVLEAQARFFMRRAIHPLVTVGVGGYRFGVEGRASWPHAALNASEVRPALELGSGVGLRLHPYFELSFELLALFAQPYPEVRFFGANAASAGRPTLLASITLGGWL